MQVHNPDLRSVRFQATTKAIPSQAAWADSGAVSLGAASAATSAAAECVSAPVAAFVVDASVLPAACSRHLHSVLTAFGALDPDSPEASAVPAPVLRLVGPAAFGISGPTSDSPC